MSNHYLNAVREMREQVSQQILAGSSAGRSADQLGLAYAEHIGRYRVLLELEERFKQILSQGDTLDED